MLRYTRASILIIAAVLVEVVLIKSNTGHFEEQAPVPTVRLGIKTVEKGSNWHLQLVRYLILLFLVLFLALFGVCAVATAVVTVLHPCRVHHVASREANRLPLTYLEEGLLDQACDPIQHDHLPNVLLFR